MQPIINLSWTNHFLHIKNTMIMLSCRCRLAIHSTVWVFRPT